MATINGTSGNDTLTGTAGNDDIFGLDGADSLNGADGNDTIYGGSDTDQLEGASGNDVLYGGAGYDLFFGGSGDDVLVGDSDNFEDFYGGDGNDTVFAGDANDNWIFGGAGNDEIFAGAGDESIEGNEGDDSIYAGAGNDTVAGGSGNDLIQGQQGNDTLFGDAGADVFELSDGAGTDTIFGGSGATDSDTIRFVSGTDVAVSFSGSESGSYSQNGGTTAGTFQDIEIVETSFGNDTVNAGASGQSQTVFSGAGNDTISGGGGDDSIDGGTGNDSIRGGAGNDTVSGGAGNDTFTFGRDGSDDTITDFDMADGDSDGFTNDQLDVSALRDLGGDPVTVGDVTVESGAGGFARLRFPEGETVTLQGVTPAQASAPGALYSMGVPCFTAGTFIATPTGDVLIDRLKAGDLVVTRDNGPQPICWIGRRRLNAIDIKCQLALTPIRIAPGVYGNDRPVLVSPQHGILLLADGQERLVRAKHLAALNGGKIRAAHGAREVVYIHLLFEDHQIIFGDNIPSESFYPGPWGLAALKTEQAEEVRQLFDAELAPRARRFVPRKALPAHIAELRAPIY